MAAEKSIAVVLRVVEFSETSLIVTLFSRDFGKIGALAKGAKRPKGPFEAALDLLSVCRIVFLRKSGDTLDLLTEAKLERRFRAGNRDLGRLYAGMYVAELLDGLTDRGDPHAELFDLADVTLQALDGDADVAAAVLRWELGALRIVGHAPSLTSCAQCGEGWEGDGRAAFGLLAGGVLCSRCRPGQRNVVSVSPAAWGTLKTFATTDFGELPELPLTVRGEIRGVVNQYLAHHLGHRPRLQTYLGMLTHE